MKKVEIYSSALCGFCHAAKRLLTNKEVEYIEYSVDMRPAVREEMMGRAGGRTSVPQIFIGDQHIGGYDDLAELDMDDELDPLLGAD
jgi:glutaredoxin 3